MDIFGFCPAAEPLVRLLFTCGSLNSVKAAFSVHLFESTVAMTMAHLQSQLLFAGQHPIIIALFCDASLTCCIEAPVRNPSDLLVDLRLVCHNPPQCLPFLG